MPCVIMGARMLSVCQIDIPNTKRKNKLIFAFETQDNNQIILK